MRVFASRLPHTNILFRMTKKETAIAAGFIKQLIRPMVTNIGRIFVLCIGFGKTPLCKGSCQRS